MINSKESRGMKYGLDISRCKGVGNNLFLSWDDGFSGLYYYAMLHNLHIC